MSQALVTVVAGVNENDIPFLRAEIDKLGNPAIAEIAEALERIGGVIHFASLNVFEAASGRGGHLVLEFSGDGDEDALLDCFDRELGQWLRPVFSRAEGYAAGESLARFWKGKTHTLKQGYFSTIGLAFAGTPGMTVLRIRKERDLARHLAGSLPRGSSALSILEEVRRGVRKDDLWNWALIAEPTPLLAPQKSAVKAIVGTVRLGIATFLWPVFAIMLAAGILTGWCRHNWVEVLIVENCILAATLATLALLVLKLRRMEDADQPEDRNPEPAHYSEITRRENRAAQNHLCVQSVMKPGLVRGLAIRLAFFVVGQLAARQYKPGFLDTLGTIHFARWILVPGTGDMLFFSNYGGSWESYLEDFITKAHGGLTGIWSNTLGYPRTQWLVRKGATDGDRFKRWARGQQVASLFWYTAYHDVTTANIRANAAIRQGLAAAQTEDEARHWLSLFGSKPHPESVLETEEIQGLIYGGFKPLTHAQCLFFEWKDSAQAARWLGTVFPSVAFGDAPPEKRALILGLSSLALPKLGLPRTAIDTFPNAFLQGMAEPVRSRVLGDCGANDPGKWCWGGRGQTIDGVAILYCDGEDTLASEAARVESGLQAHGGGVVARVPLEAITGREPFGFVDGISQPILKGTFRAQGITDPLNLIAAGEFLLGYPDNRGCFPPTPSLEATFDPENLLPLVPGAREPQSAFAQTVVEAPRDLGRNGSFLVLRQLEQDVEGFWNKMKDLAREVQRPQKWVAAKIVGRWLNGSSLVRNPSFPASEKTSEGVRVSVTDNDFLYGVEDAQGYRCPFGAHIRRANPRDSFGPGSKDQIDVSNRHRILRRGRAYRPENGQKPGLMFACLNADLERQFEFIQQTWVNNTSFHGLDGEMDPLLDAASSSCFTIPTPNGPVKLTGLARFVTVRGGGYFFLPGKRTLEFLSSLSERTPPGQKSAVGTN